MFPRAACASVTASAASTICMHVFHSIDEALHQGWLVVSREACVAALCMVSMWLLTGVVAGNDAIDANECEATAGAGVVWDVDEGEWLFLVSTRAAMPTTAAPSATASVNHWTADALPRLLRSSFMYGLVWL